MVRPHARAALRDFASTAARRTAGWGNDELSDASAVDLVIAAALGARGAEELHDARAFVQFLRGALRPRPVAVTEVADFVPASSVKELRFDTLIETLQAGAPPLRLSDALRLARVTDDLQGRRDAFDRPRYATDVAHHAAIASSDAGQGRILAAIVRFLRATRVVDIGTAYGMSALFLARELPTDGRIVTIEISEPQLTVSADVLAHESRVHRLAGASQDVVDDVRAVLGEVDFLCHDGEHSDVAYVRDFEAYLPLMPPGAVWFLDDIRWEDARVSDRANTYAGWTRIAAHQRVRRAVELDGGKFGLLQLR